MKTWTNNIKDISNAIIYLLKLWAKIFKMIMYFFKVASTQA